VGRQPSSVKRRQEGLPGWVIFVLLTALWFFPQPIIVRAAVTSLQNLRVFDTPSDDGDSLTVLWAPVEGETAADRYQVLLAEGSAPADAAAWKVVAEFPATSHYVRNVKSAWWTRPGSPEEHLAFVKHGKGVELKTKTPYAVTVALVRGQERVLAAPVVAAAEPNWINWNQLNNLLLALLFGAIVFYAINLAKRKEIFLRRIPGLDAVDEAIGRATELGKPVLYMTGAHDMNDPSTIAAAVILGRVAKRAASYETELLVPHREPITMAVCQEITKQAYLEAGKPDLFKDDANFFITSDQFSYTAAVDGIMLRRKPAANFFMGSYFAESLLLTETGASTGAIQIAGTDSDHQLPFFVTTCDYTLIGEELYAASAYLSKEPIQIGTLRGQDIGKAFILGVIGVGTALATLAVMTGATWPQVLLDLFKDLK
jgi:hypothetical protein